MITLSIDVTQLDKSRFKRITRKNGKEAVFADLILIDTPDGQFGDYMVKQSVSKAEREDGLQLPILGNAKHVEKTEKTTPRPATTESDEIPF
jgi:hypothetical protein